MGGVELFDHLDAGAAVFGDLVDVRAFHEAETNVGVAEAVGGSRAAFTIGSEVFLVEDRIEKLALPLRKDEVCRSRKAPLSRAVRSGV
jgi:hypothetical protein